MLLAIKFAMKLFYKEYKNSHIRIMSENVIAVAYINNMGESNEILYVVVK